MSLSFHPFLGRASCRTLASRSYSSQSFNRYFHTDSVCHQKDGLSRELLSELPIGLQASHSLAQKTAADLPEIDFAPWLSGSPEGKARVASELKAASMRYGFFYLANHGVADDVVENALSAQQAFFTMSAEVKNSVSWKAYVGEIHPPTSRGYVEEFGEALDPAAKPDAKEFLDLGPDSEPTRPFAGRNKWPDSPNSENVRKPITKYMDSMQVCAQELVRALATSLSLAENFFDRCMHDPVIIHRLLRYPQADKNSFGDELQIHCGKHTDYGMVTLLYQSDYGLQIRDPHSDSWLWVPPPPTKYAFTVNLGDCMQIFTNGLYQSTLHRVVNCSGKERYSMAFFLDPNFDAVVAPIPDCIGRVEAAKFESIAAGQLKLAKYSAVWDSETDLEIDFNIGEASKEKLFKQ